MALTMRLLNCLALLASTATASSTAFAEENGFELGGRLGYGFPWGHTSEPIWRGDALDGRALNDSVTGQLPVQVDLGYRINPQLFVGGYLSYGVGFVGEECDDIDGACSAGDLRFGGQLIYHFTAITLGNAGWIGGGIGFESLRLEQSSNSGDSTVQTLTGFELLNFQAGYDVAISDAFRLGPYVMLTVAQFSEVDEASELGDTRTRQSEEIDDPARHGWVMFGVKGTFGAF